ncbi:ABC transporter ATP-binding protein [Pseudomonas aeruginosa]
MTTAPFSLPAEVLLEVRRLSVRGPVSLALQDISFRLHKGRILGLVGESGAGKSLLGKVLARALPQGLRVVEGDVRFAGGDLLSDPPAEHRQRLGKRICFVPQDPVQALDPVLRIGQQLDEHFQRLGHCATSRAALSLGALNSVRIAEPQRVLQQYPHQLSGGMCQRVLIAMAFASGPDLVICDEATTALDPPSRQHIVSLLRDLQRLHGTAVLFITHDLGLASQLCDDLLVLYAGTTVEYGSARQLLDNPRHPYTRALLRARPSLRGPWQALQPLVGQMPGLEGLAGLSGCRFAPRCAQASDHCSQGPIALQHEADGRRLRCNGGVGQEPARHDVNRLNEHYALGLLGSETPFLRVEGLAQQLRHGRWPYGRQVQVLEDIDLTIAPGEFVGLIGASGSGKTSLARLLMGLQVPSAGRILLNEHPLKQDRHSWERRRQALQLVFQNPTAALNPRRTLGDLLTQPLDHRSVLRSERARRALALQQSVGLPSGMLERLADQLSGGQRQRVNIGRALCVLPQLLIADEIVSGLDASVQAQILNLLLELRREHKIALLLISHDLAVVRYLCSRVLVMDQGRIVESGETARVFDQPRHPVTQALLRAADSETDHA